MDGIKIKAPHEIEIMRQGGKILASIFAELATMAKPGVDVWDLEERFIELCEKNDAIPACKGYAPWGLPPYPTGLCLSVNEQSVHCIPRKGKKLKDGDVVTIDGDLKYKGLFVDHAVAVGVGKISEKRQKLIEITKKALDETVKLVKPGIRTGILSASIQKIVEEAGFSVVRQYAGHGIGREMHEEPEIPCFGKKTEGAKLKENMTIAIEPLVCENSSRLVHKGYWETETEDKGVFIEFEHTVLVTKDGYEILTLS